MSIRKQIVLFVPMALLVGSAGALAGKPPKAGGGDKTAPSPIAAETLSVASGALALTLRFRATGDDGTAGNAAAYDVFYRSGTSCADADNPGASPDSNLAWTRSPRSRETVPEPANSLDFFNVRPLDAGEEYCIAIRVGDEVPNWSAWRVVHGTTYADWAIGQTWQALPDSTGSYATQINLDLVNDAPVAGWMTANHTAVFAGDGWQQVVPLVVPSTSFSTLPLRLAGNPGAGTSGPTVSAAVTVGYRSGSGKNSKLINEVLLVDAGPAPFAPVVSTIASGARETGGLDERRWGGSTITYVSHDGAWNPVVTFERIDAKGSEIKRTSLTIAERVGQVWQGTGVLTREGADQSYGFFDEATVFTSPDHATLGFVAPHCGITVYAERSASGTWTYYDAGRQLMRYRVAFDSTDRAIVLGQTDYSGTETYILHYDDFVMLPGAPANTCDQVQPQANAGEAVVVGADPDVPYLVASGIAASGGATFISAAAFEGNYKTVQQRLIYRCSDAAPWLVQTIDQTNSPHTKVQPAMTAAGDLLQIYSWGGFARAGGGQYSAVPPDFVYVARHPGNLCE